MFRKIIILCLTTLVLAFGQDYDYPFQNPELNIDARVDDLVSRLTLEEKASQLVYNAVAIPRLGIPEYNWWNECLHGVARNGRATVFPQAIALGATFDTELIKDVTTAISTEGRAKYNLCSEKGRRGQYQGLTFWSPNVNIFRDPRWGRGHETYGEDPYLTSEIGKAFVKGIHGEHPKYLKAAACAKHYAVHSGPEGLRHHFDAQVSRKDMWETYLPAFEALVTEAKVEGVMGAYNRTNGQSCCAHSYLMEDVLRDQWGFDGYFTSDCWAIVDIYEGHDIVETQEEAVALALKRGCNLNCGNSYPSIPDAVKLGLVDEEVVDKNLKQLLKTRFRLGLFDPEDRVPFSKIGADTIRCQKHVQLSREAAAKSIVLLKNEDKALPIEKDLRKIYVTGPLATHIQGLLANYYGLSENLVTILEGVMDKVEPATSVMYRQGSLLNRKNLNPIDWYSGNAKNSDVTIACVGISQLIEGEEGEAIASAHKGDRKEIKLPQNQIDFLKDIHAAAQKLVVVMVSGSPIACPEVYEMADALLFVPYPGEQGGNAVADIIFGDRVPSGRLPFTFPKSVDDLPPYKDYDMQGRTYRYMEKEPLFPFGFGLSYTQFEYDDLKLSASEIEAGKTTTAKITVANTGQYPGEEVVQLYITDLEASVEVPNYSLRGFKRVSLKPGEEKEIEFEISADMLKIVNEDGSKILEPGKFRLYIGGCSPLKVGEKLEAAEIISSVLTVE